MLLNTHKKHPSSITFPQQLDYIKHRKHRSDSIGNKHSEYFKSMNTVLDLLQASHPKIID